MDQRLYADVSAKVVVESNDLFNVNNLEKELTIINKGNTKDFEVTNCLIEHVVETDPIGYYNLKNVLKDSGRSTENKYSGLTKVDAEKIKKDLKNLLKSLEVGNQASIYIKQNLNGVIKILETLEGVK